MHADITISTHGCVNTSTICRITDAPKVNLARNYGALRAFASASDFVIVSSENRAVPVHRQILTARSIYFAAMLKHDTDENAEGVCTISDLDSKTSDALLDFIYTGTVSSNDAAVVEQLLVAAEKYSFLELKEMCAIMLIGHIDYSNYKRLADLADQNSTESLKAAAFRFGGQGKGPVTKGSATVEHAKEPVANEWQ